MVRKMYNSTGTEDEKPMAKCGGSWREGGRDGGAGNASWGRDNVCDCVVVSLRVVCQRDTYTHTNSHTTR